MAHLYFSIQLCLSKEYKNISLVIKLEGGAEGVGFGGSVVFSTAASHSPSNIHAQSSSSMPEPTLRSKFPETWMWTETTCG